ncbi:MAG: type I-U CRISPR-associated helicase/endonuclease Cas3, partial [Gemmatimonadota bacterium]|nr:type I-U CRISPR-associated helicase/endonuclease Cas3 [Gemmatimonadota bacterium]
MADLAARDFEAYFKAVHGSAPFPWQSRLLREVVATGAWPATLDIPTGCGKTSVLDIALFQLALQAGHPERAASTRIALVVDRRTVVDQAYRRGQAIQAALEAAKDGVLLKVQQRLMKLSSSGQPSLQVAMLRGGIARDESWARSPTTPTILISTVDQLGSRLLFRGYGVSDSMRPVHAGLLGNDTVLFLDEVHLSQPFAETLKALSERYDGWAEIQLPRRWQTVQMSATTRGKERVRFGLDDEDLSHPIVRQRLAASKPVTLLEVKGRADEEQALTDFVAVCRKQVEELIAPGRAIALVVNRIASARQAFDELRRAVGQRADVFLVTGRMRPLDRQDLDETLLPRVRAGRPAVPDTRCTVVVSTQTIEAGADFDFDALVTECASLDALRQRFGRLNRLGQKPECRGVIVARMECVKGPDAIYGEAYGATWKFLSGKRTVDFGIDALQLPKPSELEALLSPERHSPVLLPSHLDTWVQTRPVPTPDPDVALWLHGPERGEPEVQIIWRADLEEAALEKGAEGEILTTVEACPPSSPEALAVPLSAARRWLAGLEQDAAQADVDGAPIPEELRSRDLALGRRALRWRGEESKLVSPKELRGGDTLIVPASYGGLSDANWSPKSRAPVPDLGD